MKSRNSHTRGKSSSEVPLRVPSVIDPKLEDRFSIEKVKPSMLPTIPKKKENPIKTKQIDRLRRKENKLIAYVIEQEERMRRDSLKPNTTRARRSMSNAAEVPKLKKITNYLYQYMQQKVQESNRFALRQKQPNEYNTVQVI